MARVKRRKQQNGSERVPRRSTRSSTRPRDGDIREQRPDAALDVLGVGDAQALEGAQRLHQQDQAPPGMLVNQCKRVCVEKCPVTMVHIAMRSGDSCGVSQRLSFDGNANRRPKRNTKSTTASVLRLIT